MANILVTGSSGQLGSELRALLHAPPSTVFFTDKKTLDITNKHAIENFCEKNHIEIIINCAAYTAVDKAEEDKVNADTINHLAVRYMAEIAKKQNIKLIHISTDYVFDGKSHKPYTENDTTNPQSVYGHTKLLGEQAIRSINPPGAIIIRTSWLYSSFGNNFVKTMLRLGKERDELGVIFDQIGTPTYAKDLAKAILLILNQQPSPIDHQPSTEIYNFSNEGVASWYDFAHEIMRMARIECNVKPIETKEYPTPAARPHYSLLNKTKIKQKYDLTIPHWKDALSSMLKSRYA
jgi:dTDP-4-dehydrorhamnose reductase